MSNNRKYTLCFKVDFPGDKATDHILMYKVKGAWKTYKGIFKDEMGGEVQVAFSYPDPEDGEENAIVDRFALCWFIDLLCLPILFSRNTRTKLILFFSSFLQLILALDSIPQFTCGYMYKLRDRATKRKPISISMHQRKPCHVAGWLRHELQVCWIWTHLRKFWTDCIPTEP